MAFDTKQLKMFKWLEKVTKQPRYIKSAYNSYRRVYIRFGRLYATNGYILASVDYPEFEHVGDLSWYVVDKYTDDEGKHINGEGELFAYDETAANMRDRVFEDMFISNCSLHFDQCQPFNSALLVDALYPFKLYGLSPVIYMRDELLEFSAHNSEVSIKVLVIGERK